MIKQSIIQVLAYFDLFNYPVTETEILFYLDHATQSDLLKQTLQDLVEAGIIFQLDNYFTLANDFSLVSQRKKGNRKAESLLPQAKKVAKLLYKFPFVRGVGISGSLSKNYATENSDFDYFIITKTDRLWIARSLMGLLKKLSRLVNKAHWFCMNYYIDEACLEIPEKNIFTATELLTLVPSEGTDTLHAFFDANDWADRYYAQYRDSRKPAVKIERRHLFKSAVEFMFNNSFGNRLDNWLMTRSVNRWQKLKFSGKLIDLKGKQIELPLTGKHYCKQDPQYFQTRVLTAYQQRLEAYTSILRETSATPSSLAK